MRWAGGFFAALLTLLFLSVAFLYGANLYLRDGGGQIGDIIRRYAPGTEVRFSRAGLRLGFGAAAFYAENLRLEDGKGSEIHAPRADFWLGADGIVAVLHDPEITIRRGAGPPPVLGEWTAEARRAKVRWLDADGVSLTLHNALLRARHAQGRLRASVLEETDDGRKLRAAADMRVGEDGVRGVAELAVKNWPPGVLPPQWKEWEKMQLTVRAHIDEDGARFFAAGDSAPGGDLTAAARFRANGYWDGETANITAAIAAEKWIPVADAPPLSALLRGDLQYRDGVWRWRGDILAAGEDGIAGGKIRARGDRTNIADADADLRIVGVPAQSLWKYVPQTETREWLADSVAGGTITFARLRARGLPPNLRTELTAAFSGGRIRVAEGWPDARRLNGILTADEDRVIVAGEGEIAGAAADSVRAHIPFSDAETPATLYLRAAFNRAPLPSYLAAARALPPARDEVESVMRRLHFSGDARLSLAMQVPLAAAENAAFDARLTILGDGEISVAGAELPPLSAVSGAATIADDGVRAGLRGRLENAPVSLFAENETIRIHGTIPATVALSVAGITGFPASGAAKFTLRRDGRKTAFISDLRGVSFALPPPLAKTADETAFLRAETADGETQASLHLRGDDFLLQHNGGGMDIAINESQRAPPAKGAYIHGELRGIRGGAEWLAFGGGGDDVALSLAFADSEVLNMPRQNLTVRAPPPGADGARRIILRGDAVDGAVSYRPGALRAELSRLRLANLPGGDAAPDIRGLSVVAAADDLHIGGVALGALTLRGAPAGDGWILNTLRVENGENALAAGGLYDGARTELTVLFSAPDAAAALETFGQNNVVSEGGATLAGGVSWPGAPPDFSLDLMEGNISLLAEDLRYLKSEQGVIGFLAVFSPQSLLQLGFTELGREGVQIKTMRGEIALRGGSAEFRDIVMENDDLNISLRGETDLRARTLDISGRVRPGNRLLNAGSAAGIGAIATVQPIALAAGWFLGKIFEKPLSEIGAYDYTVTGVWSDPKYTEGGDSPVRADGKTGGEPR